MQANNMLNMLESVEILQMLDQAKRAYFYGPECLTGIFILLSSLLTRYLLTVLLYLCIYPHSNSQRFHYLSD